MAARSCRACPPFYAVYECADGEFVTIGSLEPQFFALLQERLGIDPAEFGNRNDPRQWDGQRERLAAIFRSRTRDEWTRLLGDSDVCFAPVLRMTEAPQHPHNAARGVFVEVGGLVQPAPAPRFSRTAAGACTPPAVPGADTDAVLAAYGFSREEVAALHAGGVVAGAADAD